MGVNYITGMKNYKKLYNLIIQLSAGGTCEIFDNTVVKTTRETIVQNVPNLYSIGLVQGIKQLLCFL